MGTPILQHIIYNMIEKHNYDLHDMIYGLFVDIDIF